MDYKSDIGKYVKTVRKSKGLTQTALAKFLALNPATVGHYELGDIQPSGSVLWAIMLLDGINPLKKHRKSA